MIPFFFGFDYIYQIYYMMDLDVFFLCWEQKKKKKKKKKLFTCNIQCLIYCVYFII